MEDGEVDKLVKGLVQQVSQVYCASGMHSEIKKIGLFCSMSSRRPVSCPELAHYHCWPAIDKTWSWQPVTAA